LNGRPHFRIDNALNWGSVMWKDAGYKGSRAYSLNYDLEINSNDGLNSLDLACECTE